MPNSKPIRILVVDDHFMVRMGLSASLNVESDMEVVAEAVGTNGMVADNASTASVSNPGSNVARLRTDRIMRPAPTSSTTASEISATITEWRIRRSEALPVRADSLSA